MRNLNRLLTGVLVLLGPAWAQAQDRPRLMVVPSIQYMKEKGVCRDVEMEGRNELDCDLSRLLVEDKEFSAVVTNVAIAFADRGFQVEDLETATNNLKEQRMRAAMSKKPIQNSMQDELISQARPDIKLELKSELSSVMGQRRLSLTINGIDAFTNKLVAPATGASQPMAGLTLSDLAKEVVVGMMPQLETRMMNHFRDITTNGRGVTIRVEALESANLEDGLNSDVEVAGELSTISDYIAELVRKLALNGRMELGAQGESEMSIAEVRMPLNESPSSFRSKIRNQFQKDLPNLQLKQGGVSRGPGDIYLLVDKKGATP